MGKPSINVQDGFLFQHLKAETELAVELSSGRTMQGRLKRFDRFAIVLDGGSGELLIYKHAIATIQSASAET